MPLVVTSSSYKIECFPQMIEVLPLGIMSLSFCTNVFYSSVYHYGCSLMLFDVFWSFGVSLVSLATAAAFMSPLSCCHGGCIYGA